MEREAAVRKLRELADKIEGSTEFSDTLHEALSGTDWREWRASHAKPRDDEGEVAERRHEPHMSIEIRPEACDVFITGEVGGNGVNWEAIHALSDYIRRKYEE